MALGRLSDDMLSEGRLGRWYAVLSVIFICLRERMRKSMKKKAMEISSEMEQGLEMRLPVGCDVNLMAPS
jgi:hypothetical protein